MSGTEKNRVPKISSMDKIRYLFLINREILFFISPSKKDEKVIPPSVGNDEEKWA